MSKLWLPNGRRPRFTRLENHLALQEARRRIPDHILEMLDRARELKGPFEPRLSMNTWQETLYSSIATETALTAAAEAVVYPASSQPGFYGAIPGAYMLPHRTLHLRMAGQLSTAATPGTMLWKLRWGGVGGTVLVASGGAGATGTAITMAASQTNAFWRCELWITCRADGSGTAGSLIASGVFESPGIPTTNQTTFPATAPAAVGVDTTTAKDLAFTHTPSLTTASFAGMQYTLASLN
jgi:hypothetical protein